MDESENIKRFMDKPRKVEEVGFEKDENVKYWINPE
jgi:hypothetical protein